MSIDDNDDDNCTFTWEGLGSNYMYDFLEVVHEIFNNIDSYLYENGNRDLLNDFDLQKLPGIKLENYKAYIIRDRDLLYALNRINEPIFKIDGSDVWFYEKDISEMYKDGIIHKAIFESGLF